MNEPTLGKSPSPSGEGLGWGSHEASAGFCRNYAASFLST
jgi:hypothetical protein